MLPGPSIILVRPQMGENIGAAARAMHNFGLTKLRIVTPRDGWPNEQANKMAAGGINIIRNVEIFDTVPEALADINVAYATTARPRDIEKPVFTPEAAIRQLSHMAQKGGQQADQALSPAPCENQEIFAGAIVFGPERTGLENEDIALCDGFITIPTMPENFSLNLGQSVVVLAYEWFKQSGQWPVTSDKKKGKEANSVDFASLERAPCEMQEHFTWANKSDYQGLFEQLESYLDETNFFRVPEKKPAMWHNLRAMLLRGQYNAQEIRTLRGMLRRLWEAKNR